MSEALFARFQIDMTRKYGEGGYGATYAVRDRQPAEGASTYAAVKIVETKRMRLEALRAECQILEQLEHPNIVSILGHGHGPGGQAHLYYIFMEVASGGELFDQVIDRAPKAMDEDVAHGFFVQLLAGVTHCHQRGVAHRDLKLENVLLSKGGQVKLIDFGLSHVYQRDANGQLDRSTPLKRLVGSKSYVAPEVLSGVGYDGFDADLWSLGVCLFAMLAGFFPLSEAHSRDWRYPLLEAAQKKPAAASSSTRVIFGWYKRSAAYLTPAAAALLDSMLTIDPAARPSLAEVIQSPWVCGDFKRLPAGPQAIPQGGDAAAEASGPTWRGSIVGSDELRQLLAEEADEAMAPVYRALGVVAGDALPLPAFERQRAGSIAL